MKGTITFNIRHKRKSKFITVFYLLHTYKIKMIIYKYLRDISDKLNYYKIIKYIH